MRVDDFDFELPEERIALRPVVPREAARLLRVGPDAGFGDLHVADLVAELSPGDLLVFNDTKVIPAQLQGLRIRPNNAPGEGTARIDATLHMRISPERWKAFVRPAKRVAAGDRIAFGHTGGACLQGVLDATVEEKGEAGEVTLLFDLAGPALDEAIAAAGSIPLPPYIASKRPQDAQDRADYQTIYAREEGAVAAPTAGLHWTPDLIAAIEAKGVGTAFVTLHVGAGTFLPVKAETTEEHRMHAEIGTLDAETAETINAVRRAGGRIVAVGTTSLRLLESAAGEDGVLQPYRDATDIFITPGYRFRVVDRLMTNFHLPRSTLFMLVCAFSGTERMKAAYRHAIDTGYRFYSYGDACLLDRAEPSR
ncbi:MULTISPECIES: tRNA preQ1(34) S-adenosylmethionine ribosyltransferase-isomerase QueA [unclassified Aureimonas]|uniref:tRNA preQ1(34) S-adenosylmethionine ribosyltransferase-isomerase QueA n=1 Tax=unclassified Aureimonas TaxID=2615206 RepID=UPI0006F20B37|nr:MULTISPECIES: tRNA preQ1(34) S-adenosylmethionine ribosyltransferase-isomerase QueA [unclassified Aureimonas]KQT60589.1 S-adenosylmethionine:tRNA ribosyltransferase-isomerase [Aureimonas sp. Leaf427]KQT79136.1 S-adenosylmethionine:tRNA ribosyltransferase-isomerase [Aureimonas sp. Leaf460]